MKKKFHFLLAAVLTAVISFALMFTAGAADYTIGTAAELKALMDNTEAWSESDTYTLTANIDMSSETDQSPIGDNGTPFKGTFDGGGYSINGINISSDTAFAGLFGATENATVKSLTASGSVTSTYTTQSTTDNDDAYVGGLIGRSRANLTITDVTSNITVTASGSDVGGLIGQVAFTSAESTFSLTRCTNNGRVSGYKYVGGLIGRVGGTSGTNLDNAAITLDYCVNNGTVTATGNVAAGIVAYYDYTGTVSSSLTVTRSENYGTITAADYVGGILGGFLQGNHKCAASLDMRQLYNEGTVARTSGSVSSHIGGIAGIIRIPLTGTLTLESWKHAGASSKIGLIGNFGTPTAEQVAADITVKQLYNAVGQKILGSTTAISGNNISANNNNITFVTCCNTESTQAELQALAASDDSWDIGIDNVVALDIAPHTAHTFVGGVCACGMSVVDGKIGTASELIALMSDSSLWKGSYILTADIDLTDCPQSPIGIGADNSFKGTFNGDGYTVSGIDISGSDTGVGLFGAANGAVIENLTVKGKIASSGKYTGGLVGLVLGSSVTVNNVASYVDVVSTGGAAGGIIGAVKIESEGKSVSISNCKNYCNIEGTQHVAGIMGRIYCDPASDTYTPPSDCSVSITDCRNYGAINATTNNAAGIIAAFGYNCPSGGRFYINECANYANITSAGNNAAGIIATYLDTHNTFGVTTIMTELYNEGSVIVGTDSDCDAAIVGILRVPVLDADGKAPVTISNWMNKNTDTDGLIGVIGDTHGIFSLTRLYNAGGENIISENLGYVNDLVDNKLTDSLGYSLTLKDNRNSASTSEELAILAAADAWVTDENGLPELEFIHEHDLGITGICACGVSVLDGDIGTVEELVFLMNNTAAGDVNLMAKDYRLTANIDLTGYKQSPIGTSTSTFSGSLDGNGFTVSGINITGSTANLGLFGHAVGAEIKNLTIKGTVTSTATSGGNNVSALIGYGRAVTVKNCTSYVDVTCISSQFVGGFIGFAYCNAGQTVTVDNCVNYGDISAKHSVGGIIGGTSDDKTNIKFSVTNCKNYGDITASNNCAGGIFGYFNYTGTTGDNAFIINKCANYGNVTSNAFTGGILGAHLAWVSSSNGAKVNASFTELLNEGIITSTTVAAARLGGIAGYIGAHSIDENKNVTVTFEDCMHTGIAVCNGSQYDSGLIGRVGLNVTENIDATFTTNNIYNAANTVYITSPTVTVVNTYACDTSSTVSQLLALTEKTNWLSEGTDTAPAPMLAAFHEHTFVDGACACGYTFDYAISDADEMLIFMTHEELWNSDCVIDADIDLTDVSGQQPVGTSAVPYAGTFNGQEYTVKGLHIVYTAESGAGLFGAVSGATVKNVVLEDAYVSGKDAVAGIIGIAYAPVTVSGCEVEITVESTGARAAGIVGDLLFGKDGVVAEITDCRASGSVSGTGHLGGIVGRIRTTSDRMGNTDGFVTGVTVKISKCTSSVNISGSHYDETDAGGIVGRIAVVSDDSSFTVTNCVNNGTLSGPTCIGGIIGRLNVDDNNASNTLTGNKFTITSNTNNGTVNCTYDFGGGIIGVVNNKGDTAMTLDKCSNYGDVTAGAYAGGIIGSYYNRSYFKSTVSQTVSKCANYGKITAKATEDYAGENPDKHAGGIFGLASTTSLPVTISEVYNEGEVSAAYAYAGGIVGYLRNYGHEGTAYTGAMHMVLLDAYNKGSIYTTGDSLFVDSQDGVVGGIAGQAAGDGPLTVKNTVSTGTVSGSDNSLTSIYSTFGRVNVGSNNVEHVLTCNYYTAGTDTKAELFNVSALTNEISAGAEKMVDTDAWSMGLETPELTYFFGECNSEHTANETYKWAYDGSQYYLTCSYCGEKYAHQNELPTVYVGNNSSVGLDVNTGMTSEKKVRTLTEAVERLTDVGGNVAVSGGIAMTDNITLPDWGDNVITFTSDAAYHDTNGAVTTGFLINTMDVRLVMGGKSVFNDILFKAGNTDNYRIIISANWHDIDMQYIRSQEGATCYLLAGLYSEGATSKTLDSEISVTVNIDGPAIAESSKFRGYFYERVYLGSAFASDNPDGTTISNKTVTLNVQDGYVNNKAQTRSQKAIVYFLFTMSTSDWLEDVYTEDCTSIVNLNGNSGIHAFATGYRNVGEATTEEVTDPATGETTTKEFTEGNAHLDNLCINFNDNSNIVDKSDDVTFANSGRVFLRNVENTVINISTEDDGRTEPLIHRLFFFKNGTFDENTTANVTLNCGSHAFLSSLGDDVVLEQGLTGNINKVNYIVEENVKEEGDWDDGEITANPTPTSKGIIIYTCQICGRTVEDEIEHIEVSQGFYLGVTLLSEYVLEYIVPVDADVTDVRMVFEKDGEDTVTVEPYEADGKWRFTVPGIAGKEMNDTISGTYYYTKGGVCYKSPTKLLNLVSYYSVMSGTSDAKLKAVLDAMFNYGAAAQTYFGYNTEHLVTEHLAAEDIVTDFETAVTTPTDESTVGDATGFDYSLYGQDAVLNQRIGVTLYFETEGDIDTTNLTFEARYKNINGSTLSISVPGENMFIETINGKTLLCVYVDTVAAKDLRQEFTGELYDGETQVSPSVSTSFEAYAAKTISNYANSEDTDKQNLVAVCRAILAYSDAAAEYLKK